MIEKTTRDLAQEAHEAWKEENRKLTELTQAGAPQEDIAAQCQTCIAALVKSGELAEQMVKEAEA